MRVYNAVDTDLGRGPRSPYLHDGQEIEVGGERFAVSVPAGLALTDLAAQRLARRLHEGPSTVDVLVAPAIVPPAGASGRSDAERRLLLAEQPLRTTEGDGPTVCSVRRMIDTDDQSRADDTGGTPAAAWLDPDVVAQDLTASFATPLADATADGRPVFPCGPVALLLAVDDDPATAELGRTWSGALIERGIEARLAVATLASGPHLTSPCSPSAATVAALQPDVIIALDARAASVAGTWAAGTHAVEIHVDDAAVAHQTTDATTVSWRIGATTGNLRHRVGRHLDVDHLAELVNRCCGQPPQRTLAELEAARPGQQGSAVSVLVGRRRGTTRPRITSIELVGRARNDIEAAWWDGLVDQFTALGCSVDVSTDISTSRTGPDLRLWGGPAAAHAPVANGRNGRTASLAAVLLGVDDLEPATTSGDATRITDQARRTVASVGAALTPSATVEQALVDLDLPVRRLPPFLGREHLRDLRAATTAARAGRPAVIGWQVAGSGAETAAVGDGLRLILDQHPDLAVALEIDGPGPMPPQVPAARRRMPSTNGDARDVADRRVQIWTPGPGHVATTGDLGRAVEAMLAGVPVVAAPSDRAALGRLGRSVAVPFDPDDPRSWAAAIEQALTGHGLDTNRTQIQARMLHGDQAAAVRGHRILGWLLHRSAR